jgi:hypothetical protein
VSFRTIGGAATALLLSFILGPIILRALRGQKMHQVVREGTPDSHASKGRELHEDVARTALASPVEVIGGVGEFGTALAAVGPNDPRVVTGADPVAVWSTLSGRLQPDAVILLKGSRGVRLEQLVPAITEWAKKSGLGTVG